jgi:hypothetical protein
MLEILVNKTHWIVYLNERYFARQFFYLTLMHDVTLFKQVTHMSPWVSQSILVLTIFLVTWAPCAYYFRVCFERPIGIVASVNHTITNLDRALLHLFSSVRGNCPVKSCILGIRWVFHAENRLFRRICVTEHYTVRECQSRWMCFWN